MSSSTLLGLLCGLIGIVCIVLWLGRPSKTMSEMLDEQAGRRRAHGREQPWKKPWQKPMRRRHGRG